MAAESLDVDLLAEAVADGSNVDWDAAESGAGTPDELEVVRQLRVLAAVGVAARARTVQWGYFEIRAEVGSGTFGTVYRAWDPRLEREVALKLLAADTTEGALIRVTHEGRMLARLRHPNVVTVFGADVFEGRAGLWMEFVTGQTLKQLLDDTGPLGANEALTIGRDVCRALAAVHNANFIHRDVKAQNVMREAGGRIVLMDFGAGAGAGQDVALAGTPVYLAPELFAGAAPSVASDLYALGVLLFHLVTGEFPSSGDRSTSCGSRTISRAGCSATSAPTCPTRSSAPSIRHWCQTRPADPPARVRWTVFSKRRIAPARRGSGPTAQFRPPVRLSMWRNPGVRSR